MDLREIGLGVWIGFDWLRTGTGGGLWWVRWWAFGFLRHAVSYISNAEVDAISTADRFIDWFSGYFQFCFKYRRWRNMYNILLSKCDLMTLFQCRIWLTNKYCEIY
jgi:hypothetical protein